MNRDEIILSCQELVSNLVRKYNNHEPDEDLEMVGITAVIKCVDQSLADGMTDLNQIQARCNVWARNEILQEIYKEKLNVVYDENLLEEVEAPEELSKTIAEIRSDLTPKQREVFDLRLYGYDFNEICEKLQITPDAVYKHLQKIREKLKS